MSLTACPAASLLVGLHGGEQKHFFDVIGVRQKHRQSVDTHSPSSCGWKSVFKGPNEVFVNTLSFVITIELGLGLLLEAFKLDLGVIQLGVGVDHFVLVGEELETLSQAILGSVPLGQRAHQLGVVDDEARRDALRLKVLTNEFVNEAGRGAWVGALNTFLGAKLVKVFAGLLGFKVPTSGQSDSKSLFKTLHHLDASEGRGEVDLVNLFGVGWVVHGVVVDLILAVD